MKTYFVNKNNAEEDVRDALGRLIEYAKLLEKETGRDNYSFVDQILTEDDILYTIEDI